MWSPYQTTKYVALLVLCCCIGITSFTFTSNSEEVNSIIADYKNTSNSINRINMEFVEGSTQVASTQTVIPGVTSTSGAVPTPGNWICLYQSSGHGSRPKSEVADWNGTIISGSSSSTISGGGCGFMSCWHAIVNLNTSVDSTVFTPLKFNSIMPADVGHAGWPGGVGMVPHTPKKVFDWLDSLGTYGHWECIEEYQGDEFSTKACQKCLDAIKKYAGDPDKCVILSTSVGMFTTGRHIINCINYDKATDTFNILDSSGTAEGYCGVKDGHKGKINFPASSQSYKGHKYWMKHYYVIQFKGP